MAYLKKFLIVTTLLVFSGCGGGGSSDGGGSTIVYNGSESVVLSASGVRETISLGINISITNNNVTITDSDGDVFKGSLSGTALTATGIIMLGNLGNGIVCEDLPLGYKGTINGADISGTISGNLSCTGNGVSVPFNVTGTFTASSGAAARQQINNTSGIADSVRSMIQ